MGNFKKQKNNNQFKMKTIVCFLIALTAINAI